ncbi:hypothetical protein [Chitinophaga sp. 212800010-3]|uniref:hypothetical protein n=1 Tax=unclassified Chitinophaga TaxID=2619133 RepID=UPI002DE723CD|nr:ATP-grasp-3 domain-containing protein [Chitinophaga sp. 212800010-3]
MDRKRIIVTGIGGNVGQGIVRNIRKEAYDIHITGTNTTSFSGGNHLCDIVYQVPFAYTDDYIPELNRIIANEGIDLIIPSTDYEVYYLALHRDRLNAPVAVSGVGSAEIYLDKYLSFLQHQKFNIPFANSILPSAYTGQFEKFILKPRKGRGSRGLHFNPPSWAGFSDEEYMVQELHAGEEITTAFYVTRNGELHGHITLLRHLDNGATNQCKVVFEHDEKLTAILEDIIRHSDIRGAANLQSIVTSDGKIHPFELNCRISGTNSIRSNFGFDDVNYTIQEYLYNTVPDKPVIKGGVAVRILMDVIYPDQTEFSAALNRSSVFYIF